MEITSIIDSTNSFSTELRGFETVERNPLLLMRIIHLHGFGEANIPVLTASTSHEELMGGGSTSTPFSGDKEGGTLGPLTGEGVKDEGAFEGRFEAVELMVGTFGGSDHDKFGKGAGALNRVMEADKGR